MAMRYIITILIAVSLISGLMFFRLPEKKFIAKIIEQKAIEQLGGITPTGTYSSTTSAINLNSNKTIYVSFKASDVTNYGYIFTQVQLNPFKLYIHDGKLKMENTSNLTGNSGLWSIPVTINTPYQLSLRYDFSGNDLANPEMWLNGIKQTVTEEVTPNDSITSNIVLYVGQSFTGLIGDIAILDGLMNDEAMANLTSNFKYRTPLMYSSTTNYWEMSEAFDGTSMSGVIFKDMKGGNNIIGGTGTGKAIDFLSYN